MSEDDTAPSGRRLAVDLPKEPADRAVVLDRGGKAWQRRGRLWLPCGSVAVMLGPIEGAKTWAHLVVDHGPLTPLVPETAQAARTAGLAAQVERDRVEAQRRADLDPRVTTPPLGRDPLATAEGRAAAEREDG